LITWAPARTVQNFWSVRAVSSDHPTKRGDPPDRTRSVLALLTEPGWSLHTAEEIGSDDFQASRSPDAFYYRTTPFSRKGDSTLTVAAMFFMVEAGLREL